MIKINNSHRPLMISVVAFVLTIYPTFFSWFTSGLAGIFQWFAADTFYYMAIAKNSSWFPLFSFDGIHPTNGFHPLWQVILKLSFLTPALSVDQSAQLIFVYFLSGILVSLSAGIIVYGMVGIGQPAALTLISIVPGLFFFLFSTVNPHYGNIWSYTNGMESPVSLFLFSCLFVLLLKNPIYKGVSQKILFQISICLSLLALARLDDIFIIPSVLLPIFLGSESIPDRIRKIFLLTALPVTIISIYCSINYQYAGTPLPISGLIKNGVSLLPNSTNFINVIFPLLEIGKKSPWLYWDEVSWRALHNVATMIVAIGFLAILKFRICKKDTEMLTLDAALISMAAYILLKGFYNLVFVALWHQGHWYYPISIVGSNLLVCRIIHNELLFREYLINLDLQSRRDVIVFSKYCLLPAFLVLVPTLIWTVIHVSNDPVFLKFGKVSVVLFILSLSGIAFLLALLFAIRRGFISEIAISPSVVLTVLLIFITANGVMAQKEKYHYNQNYELLWRNRMEISSRLKNLDAEIKLLSFDDGIDAYSLDIPVMSGFGFALDKEAAIERARDNLLEIAWHRGFRYLTSLNYMPHFNAEIGDNVSSCFESFLGPGGNRGKWSFFLVFEDEATGFKVVSIVKNYE